MIRQDISMKSFAHFYIRSNDVYNLTQGLSKFYADNERIIDEYEDNHDSYLF